MAQDRYTQEPAPSKTMQQLLEEYAAIVAANRAKIVSTPEGRALYAAQQAAADYGPVGLAAKAAPKIASGLKLAAKYAPAVDTNPLGPINLAGRLAGAAAPVADAASTGLGFAKEMQLGATDPADPLNYLEIVPFLKPQVFKQMAAAAKGKKGFLNYSRAQELQTPGAVAKNVQIAGTHPITAGKTVLAADKAVMSAAGNKPTMLPTDEFGIGVTEELAARWPALARFDIVQPNFNHRRNTIAALGGGKLPAKVLIPEYSKGDKGFRVFHPDNGWLNVGRVMDQSAMYADPKYHLVQPPVDLRILGIDDPSDYSPEIVQKLLEDGYELTDLMKKKFYRNDLPTAVSKLTGQNPVYMTNNIYHTPSENAGYFAALDKDVFHNESVNPFVPMWQTAQHYGLNPTDWEQMAELADVGMFNSPLQAYIAKQMPAYFEGPGKSFARVMTPETMARKDTPYVDLISAASNTTAMPQVHLSPWLDQQMRIQNPGMNIVPMTKALDVGWTQDFLDFMNLRGGI